MTALTPLPSGALGRSGALAHWGVRGFGKIVLASFPKNPINRPRGVRPPVACAEGPRPADVIISLPRSLKVSSTPGALRRSRDRKIHVQWRGFKLPRACGARGGGACCIDGSAR